MRRPTCVSRRGTKLRVARGSVHASSRTGGGGGTKPREAGGRACAQEDGSCLAKRSGLPVSDKRRIKVKDTVEMVRFFINKDRQIVLFIGPAPWGNLYVARRNNRAL